MRARIPGSGTAAVEAVMLNVVPNAHIAKAHNAVYDDFGSVFQVAR
jgi:aspartate aminotransferase-like enzyme